MQIEPKINMHEAREGIIARLARDLPTAIDLDRFLRAVVSEIGRMMNADRCDVIQLTETSELRISHEWQASDKIPSSEGLIIPFDAQQLSEHFDLSRPLRINDTAAAEINPKARLFAASLETRSLLVVPIIQGEKVLGLLGLHDTQKPRIWLDEEVSFLQSIAQQLAVGYQYTRIFTDKQQEATRTKALLEIANILNSHSDFGEVSSLVLERAIELVGADYGALGVIDQTGKRISLAAFKASPNAATDNVRGMISAHGQSLDIAAFPALMDLLSEGKTLELLDTSLPPPIKLIFNSQLGGRAALVAAVKIGGQSFGLLGCVWSAVREGFDKNEIALVEGIADQIGTALERDQLSAEVMRLKSALHERQRGNQIIGQAPQIHRAIELALNVADTQTTVLIQGESGTGKELLANLIHYNSGREKMPHIKLNCGAIPETLLESELFGHEKGAFTDARTRRRGRFEEADGGTLFLDEIGEMSLSAQVRLLRVLQDGEFARVGGNETVKSDVRVVAASNVDLEKAVEEGRFRRDLYYRLSVFPIKLPPLRERREDIQLLVVHFLELYKQKTGRFVSGISKDALRALVNYDFPGNIRELENAIERAIIIASGRQIELEDLPEAISQKPIDWSIRRFENISTNGDSPHLEIELPITMDEIERETIQATLELTKGDKSRAARLLGIRRKTLYRKLEQYDKKTDN
ncbi:MAG TPA: sigma 54-interacting transcriptional regulator [Pyrinomonadaceae bacterium]|nr:sigma 54-interacting transcriptional regulator [Pyrinomonadaceae bacterium]